MTHVNKKRLILEAFLEQLKKKSFETFDSGSVAESPLDQVKLELDQMPVDYMPYEDENSKHENLIADQQN